MPADKQTQLRVNERRQEVARLFLQGVPQYQIGRHLKVSQTLVSLDLKALNEEWLESARRDTDALKAEQLAKLTRLESAAWEAWLESREDLEARSRDTVKGRVGKDGEPLPDQVRTSKRRMKSSGVPAYLQTALDCWDKRCKLLGLYPKEDKDKAGATGPGWEVLWGALKDGPSAHAPEGDQVVEGKVVGGGEQQALPAPEVNGRHQQPTEGEEQ